MGIFNCTLCGNCCRNIRGRLSKESLIGRIPLQYYINKGLANLTIDVPEWKIDLLKEKARILGINLRIAPTFQIWDDFSQTSIALQWQMDHEDCPFLSKKNLCLINDSKPLTCQSYPVKTQNFIHLDYFETSELIRDVEIKILDCQNALALSVDIQEQVEIPSQQVILIKLKYFEEAYARYGNSFLSGLRQELTNYVLSFALKSLAQDWKIYPAIIDEEIKTKILSSQPIGLLKFLKEKDSRLYQKTINQLEEIDSLTYEQLKNKL